MDLKDITYRINSLKEELDKLRPLNSEDEQRVMQKFRLDWNYNSNNIEGNTLTYGETKALILFGITAQGKPLKDHLEIEGHNEAIDYIVKIAQNKEPLTEAMIRNLHKVILKEEYEIDAITQDGQATKKLVQIGKYKSTPNHVKTVTGEVFRFAAPEETPAKMEELLNWYRENQNNDDIHPLILAVEFHYRFIRIHPFDDGNGRIVRLLMNLILMQKGLPPVIVKVKEKKEYYRALQQADSGNIEPFIIFIGRQLISSLELMITAAKGNAIEEEDDIEKKISLLYNRIQSKNKDVLPKIKSDENVKKIYERLIFPLIDKFLFTIQKINKFYKYKTVHVGSTNSYLTMELDKFDEYWKDYPIDVTKDFYFRYNLEEAIILGTGFIEDKIEIKVIFHQNEYTIYPGKIKPISLDYSRILLEKTINQIAHLNLESSLKLLEEHLK